MDNKNTAKKWLTTKQKADEEGVSIKTILRRANVGLYPGAHQVSTGSKWMFPTSQSLGSQKAITPQEIAIEEAHKKAVLSHFEELRGIAKQWKAQLWLPVPWQWDIIDLKQVFYNVVYKGKTGYKLPGELVEGEISLGHFRKFSGGSVYWSFKKDGTLVLRLPVENENYFKYLRNHTQDSIPWGLFTQWKEVGGTYIQYCESLLNRISRDVRKSLISDSNLAAWIIYHDAFCIKSTAFRCETCGKENNADSSSCKECGLPMGWLYPIGKRFDSDGSNSETGLIRIQNWGTLEESIESSRIEGVIRGIKALLDKYRGCDMTELILDTENEVRSIQNQLFEAIEAISQNISFEGYCQGCPSLESI